MQRIFRRYLLIIMVIACTVLLGVNYFLSGVNIRSQQRESFHTKLEQIIQTFQTNSTELNALEAATDEDYLTRAQAFAYMIEKNPEVLDSLSELTRIAKVLSVDELHVTDENGIIRYSTVPKYIGMDFHSGKQMQEFLPLLEDTTGTQYIAQKEQANTAEDKVMKYVGISRGTPAGIIQVGITPTRLMAARNRNTCSYVLSGIPTDSDEHFIAFDDETGGVIGATYENLNRIGHSIDSSTLAHLRSAAHGKIYAWDEDHYYVVTMKYDDIRLCAAIKTTAMYSNRLYNCMITSVYMIILGIILTIFLDRLIDRTSVQGIHRILAGLNEIQKGNMDTRIAVKDNPELSELSDGINAMVDNIMHSNVRMSKVLDMTGISLASFECEKDSDKVIYTSLLPALLNLSLADQKTLFGDKMSFMEYIHTLQEKPVPEEANIYHVDQNGVCRYLKISLVSDEQADFGIIMDVTEDVTNNQIIRYEHDHDNLTGLPIYQYFEKTVESMLSDPEFVGCAAAVMMDLDKFKSVNDTYGHDFGDRYLQHMAQKMREIPAEHCFPSRRSGDEFCLFLYGYSSCEELLEEMKKFWRSLAESEIQLPDGNTRAMVASAGIAWVETGITMPRLMYNADVALYKAKKQLPGTFQIFRE